MARKKKCEILVCETEKDDVNCYTIENKREISSKKLEINHDIKNNPYSDDKEIVCKDTGEVCKGSEYLYTRHWKQKKKDLYCWKNGICQRCHNHVYFGFSRVHHLNYDRMGDERLKDLMLLCEKCHGEIHGLGEINLDRRKWLINNKLRQKHGERIQPYIIEGYADIEMEDDLEKWFEIEKSKIPATEKQITFAKQISETLNIDLPEINTKDNYRDFISQNIDSFNKAKKGEDI